jgi:cytochrome oxidase Cu insertion factor (SCO1/SenC/PrrC family)
MGMSAVHRAAVKIGAALLLLATLGSAPAPAVDFAHLVRLNMTPVDGQPAHPFTLPTLDGKTVSLDDLKGHVVLLYFWATW